MLVLQGLAEMSCARDHFTRPLTVFGVRTGFERANVVGFIVVGVCLDCGLWTGRLTLGPAVF
jgi:hypothetical protein